MTETDSDETARIYRTLASLYLEPPTEDRIAKLQRWANAWLENAGETLPRDIAEPLETIGQTDASETEELATEFARLFRGVSPSESPDPPYESLYRDGSIYGPSTTRVRNAYREAGLDISEEESREPADHIGIELQFLGELRATEGENGAPVREHQRTFIEEHVGSWIEDLRDAVEEADAGPFYRAVLRLTEGVLALEIERLQQST